MDLIQLLMFVTCQRFLFDSPVAHLAVLLSNFLSSPSHILLPLSLLQHSIHSFIHYCFCTCSSYYCLLLYPFHIVPRHHAYLNILFSGGIGLFRIVCGNPLALQHTKPSVDRTKKSYRGRSEHLRQTCWYPRKHSDAWR